MKKIITCVFYASVLLLQSCTVTEVSESAKTAIAIGNILAPKETKQVTDAANKTADKVKEVVTITGK